MRKVRESLLAASVLALAAALLAAPRLTAAIEVVQPSPSTVRLAHVSLVGPVLGYRIENVSGKKLGRLTASLVILGSRGTPIRGASWCVQAGGADAPGKQLAKELPFNSSPSDNAVLMLTSISADGRVWSADGRSALKAAQRRLFGDVSATLALHTDSAGPQVSGQSAQSPDTSCPGFCIDCRADADATCGAGNIKNYSCSLSTCTCSYECFCPNGQCQ